MKRRSFFSRSKSKKRSTSTWKSKFVSRAELLEARQMLAGDVMQNPSNVYDVNNDSYVSPSDAAALVLQLVNTPRTSGAQGEPTVEYSYLDVTGDGEMNQDDLLAVVAEINGSGEPGDGLTFEFETFDTNGNAISEIDAGDEFELVVYAQDTGPAPEGVFAAYLDIEFDSSLATAQEIQHNAGFPEQNTGTISSGLIDEAGAFTTVAPSTPDRQELLRVVLRADSPGELTISSNPADNLPLHDALVFGQPDPVDLGDILYPTVTLQVNGEQQGEVDLVGFARALADNNVQLWTSTLNASGAAADQLDLFAEGQNFLPINEVFDFVPSASDAARFPLTAEATAAAISSANIWIWPNGDRSDGSLLTLEEISTLSGVAIPTGATPSIVPIDDVSVQQGSPLQVPLNGYDPNGDALTYTVTVGDSNILDTFIPQGNRSLRIPVTQGSENLGDLVFELFEGRASRATEQIITLAEDGFYDGIIFHRVIDQFVIQGGDPTGTGAGGSSLPDFDDQFHVDLQHTSSGLLSMAKSSDDTNNSQFFVTEVPTQFLDFNHTIFGRLVEGDRVLQTISNVQVNASDRPIEDVVMNNVTVFEDNENAVLMLEGLAGSGSTTVTVTATDSAGNSTTETFNVDLTPDVTNGAPFLSDIDDQVFEVGEDIEFQVEAIDVENDPISFSIALLDGDADDMIAISDDGVVTASGWVGVRQANISVGGGADNQVISISVLSTTAPTSVDLVASADSGLSDSDNLTNVTELAFEVSGVSDGATVIVFSGDTEVGRAEATGDTVTVTQANTSALGSGEQQITAVVEQDGLRSSASPALTIVLDQIAPEAITNNPDLVAEVGTEYTFNAEHIEEGTGEIQYSLSNAPTGLQIDAFTGELTWTPTSDQRGTQSFDIVVSDLAGNETTRSVEVQVSGLSAGVTVELRNASGNSTSTLVNGESFFVDVFVEDLRDSATGLTGAFVDLAFDPQGVAAVDTSSAIQVGASFGNAQQTGTISATGVVNVGGEAAVSVVGRTLLATIPMVAQGSGALLIDVSVNDTNGITLDGESQPVADTDLEFFGASLFVLGVSDELTAVDDTLTIDEDSGEHTIDALLNDTVTTAGGDVTITSVSSAEGTVAISEDGRTITYTPAPNFPIDSATAQDDVFTYTISDSTGATSTATVTVTVNPTNDPPTANDDFFPADLPDNEEGEAIRRLLREDTDEILVLRVLLNDAVTPDDPEIALVTDVTSETSTVEVSIDSFRTAVNYTPGPNVFGEDTFIYTITDTIDPGTGVISDGALADTAVATVIIAQVNDAPVAENDTLTAAAGENLVIDVATLINNDTAGPLEDEVQTLEIVSFTQPSNGTLTINADGSFTYLANAGATGTDTFTYTIQDDGITEDFNEDQDGFVARDDFLSDTATVTIEIGDDVSNTAPLAQDDEFPVINDGTTVTLPVLTNDVDNDTSSLTVTAVGNTSNGGTVLLSNGVVTYTPAVDFVGTDTFTYTVSDGEFSDTAEVTVNVTEPGEITNSRFSGSVFLDANNNGTQDASESGIGGVPITLSGTDTSGNSILREVLTADNGTYQFDTLPQGTFEISQSQSSVLIDGADIASGFASNAGDDTFSITVGDTLVVAESNTFAERGLSPQLALIEALSSRRSNTGFLTAATSEGSDFVSANGGWEDYSNVRVSVTNDEVTIDATDENSQSVTTTTSLDDSRVSLLGRDGDTWLIRIIAAASAFVFQDDDDA